MPAEAVLRALRHVWATLRPLDIPMAVMGGIALATWKVVRATRDVDLLLGVPGRDLGEVLAKLREAAVRPKHEAWTSTVGEFEIVQCLYEPPEAYMDLQIDLFLAKSGYPLQALERRVVTRLPDLDLEVAVLACEDLILHKLLAGRIIDRVDAAALLRANRESIDFDYLARCTRALKLAAEFTEVWREALPGEPPPDNEHHA
jgi:hypothetical protein